jgi:hypothetical protein
MNKLVKAEIVLVERSFGLLACIPREGEWIDVYQLNKGLEELGYDHPGKVGTVTFEITKSGTKPNGKYDNPFMVADRSVMPVIERREINLDLERFDLGTIGSEVVSGKAKHVSEAADDIPL